jgi:hypothetical protein
MKLVAATAVMLALSLPAAGATVRVHVHRGAFTGPIELAISPIREDRPFQPVAAQTLAKDANDAVFASVPAGSYIVLAAGPQPLQRAAAKVVVAASDTRDAILTIPQRHIDGRLTLGGKPLAGVRVRLQKDALDWSTEAVTDADGAIRGALWDGGTFDLAIDGGTLPSLVRSRITIAGHGDPATFALDLPARRIRGTVVDERDEPVDRALVVLRAKSGDLPTNVRTMTGPDGVFEYAGIHPGPYTLDVISPRYLLRDSVAFDAREADSVVRERIVVNSGRPRSIDVVDDHGSPLPDALVVCTTGASLRNVVRTDSRGHAILITPPDDPGMVWVAPANGSLAAVRLDRDQASAKIIVPPPSASLEVSLRTTTGVGVPHVSLLLRYNGMIIPPSFQKLLRRELFDPSTSEEGRATLSRIPTGFWEAWPYNSEEEAEALMASVSAAIAPINVNVVSGENHVVVRLNKHR